MRSCSACWAFTEVGSLHVFRPGQIVDTYPNHKGLISNMLSDTLSLLRELFMIVGEVNRVQRFIAKCASINFL